MRDLKLKIPTKDNTTIDVDGDVVLESEDDEYSNDKRNKEEDDDDDDEDDDDNEVEGELDNTVPEKLFSPAQPFVMKKHSRGRRTPAPPPSSSSSSSLPTGSTKVPPPPPPSSSGASTGSTKKPSTKQKFKTPRSRRSTPSMSHVTPQTLSVIQSSTKKVYRVGGVSIVCKNKAANITNIAVATFKKADQVTMAVRDKNSLITMFSSNQ